jgi:hypothetical protein
VTDKTGDSALPTGENWAGDEFTGSRKRKSIQQLVIADIAERERHGMTVYGTAIFDDTPNDPAEGGPIGQAYREALDLVIYLRWYIARHGTSAAFAFGALKAIETGEWDQHLEQLAAAIRYRRSQIR